MKRLSKFAIILTIICLLISCSSSNDVGVLQTESIKPSHTDSPSLTPIISNDKDERLKRIEFTLINYFGDSTEYLERKKNYMEWMTNEYGVDFVVHYPRGELYLEVLKRAAKSDDLKGLVQIFSSQDNREWMDEGLIYPLNNFLAENNNFNSNYPKLWKTVYTFDSELWGIARGDDGNPSMFTRSIRGDWLAALGLQRPTTVWELYDASYKFTYNDPDGNGIDDTFGMTSRTTWLMQDIFQAFDARLNHIGYALPTWNPNINRWEDSMLKPEMVECLELLQKMTIENIMDREAFIHSSSVARGKVQSGYYGGLFYWDSWVQTSEASIKQNFPDAWMDAIYALKGNIIENINQYNLGQGSPYVMTATTLQPKETINWFVNIFYGSAEGLFRGKYGIQGEFLGDEMFTLSDNKVYINFYMKDGKITGFGSPGVIGGHPDYAIGTVYEVIYNSPDLAWNEATSNKVNSGLKQRKAWFDEALAWNGIYILPESLKEPESDQFLQISSDLSNASQEAISKSMISEVLVTEALEKYKQTAKALGAQEVLDLANKELGKVSSQKY